MLKNVKNQQNSAIEFLTKNLKLEDGVGILRPLGSDKSQILRDFDEDDELHFFGDRMEEGGNDYSLAVAVQKRCGFAYNVENYTETWKLLSKYD